MIKKLKRRFFIIYMVILSCFLITILSGIYFIQYRSEITSSQQIIEMAMQNNTGLGDMNSSPPKKIINFDDGDAVVPTVDDYYIQDEMELTTDDISSEILESNLHNNGVYYGYYGTFEEVFKPKEDVTNNDDDTIEDSDEVQYSNNDDYQQNDFEHEPSRDDWSNFQQEDESISTSDVSKVTPSLPSMTTNDISAFEYTPIDTEVNMENHQDEVIMPSENVDEKTNVDITNTDITEDTKTSIEETTTIEDASTETTSDISTTKVTSISTSSEKSSSNKPSNKPDDKPDDAPEDTIYTEYEGNLARNTIYVSVDKDGDIKRISYQYFESSDNISLEQTVGEIIKSGSMEGKIEIDSMKFRYAVFAKEDSLGYNIIFLDRAIEISTLNSLLITLISIGGIGLIVLFVVSWLLSSWAITPIAHAWDKQKQFIADASHELKTPLTVIATNTDVILANANDTVQNQSKWLTYIKSETARMSKLVSDLLYIAKSDANEIALVMNEFNLSHTTLGVCLVFETVAFENGKLLDTDIDENILYSGDEDRIKQLITILVDNAIVHSEGNANIMVSLKRDSKDKIKLSVSNTNGEDIPKGYEERLFERFFRVDKARNRSNGSHGLGLNIAQSIVNNHNGTISVTSTKDHVVTFTVTL